MSLHQFTVESRDSMLVGSLQCRASDHRPRHTLPRIYIPSTGATEVHYKQFKSPQSSQQTSLFALEHPAFFPHQKQPQDSQSHHYNARPRRTRSTPRSSCQCEAAGHRGCHLRFDRCNGLYLRKQRPQERHRGYWRQGMGQLRCTNLHCIRTV